MIDIGFNENNFTVSSSKDLLQTVGEGYTCTIDADTTDTITINLKEYNESEKSYNNVNNSNITISYNNGEWSCTTQSPSDCFTSSNLPSASSLKEFLGNLSKTEITIEKGKYVIDDEETLQGHYEAINNPDMRHYTFNYDYDETNKKYTITVNVSSNYQSATDTYLNSALNGIVSQSSKESVFNLLKFKNYLDPDNKNLCRDIGLTGENKTKYEAYFGLLKNYTSSIHDFCNFVTGNNTDEESALEKELKNLKSGDGDEYEIKKYVYDLDLLCKFLKEKNISYSKEFANIVKMSLLDSLMSVYGEPKYSWIDAYDSNNSQNTDAKAKWYTNLFNRMTQGYKTLEDGLASSSKWLESALESGTVTMEQVNSNFDWKSLDYKSCSNIKEESAKDAAVAKAEAEYTRAMRDIEAKDRIFEIQLKNIDTEHSALKEEYDSVKRALDKNIDRTMKFDQSS